MPAEIVTLKVATRQHEKACECTRWRNKMELSNQNDTGNVETTEQAGMLARKVDWASMTVAACVDHAAACFMLESLQLVRFPQTMLEKYLEVRV